jgi:predicted N-acetyltransferase YhbS
VSVEYRTGAELDLDEVIELYHASTLAARRPAGDRGRMGEMLAHSNLVVSAHDGRLLVGIARSITDWAYATYLSDLAVHSDYQGRGIGRELVVRTHDAAPRSRLILLSAPAAVDYYPRIGMERHPAAFSLPPKVE